MKFSKTLLEKSNENAKIILLPIYPYKKMKKIIKKTHTKEEMIQFLKNEIKRIDLCWKWKSIYLIYKAKLYITKHIIRKAQYLLEWGNLYKEATRKILKKYNKQKGNQLGKIENKFEFNFQNSNIITELKGICRKIEEKECCICMEALFMPYSKSCGHIICAQCYSKLKKEKCPICRNQEKWTKIHHSYLKSKESEKRIDEYYCTKYKSRLKRTTMLNLWL